MAGMTLDEILAKVDSPSLDKTASVQTTELEQEIQGVLSEDTEKTASGTEDLEKLASEVLNQQNDVMYQDAFIVGAAMRDGYEARGSFYGDNLEKTSELNAQAQMDELKKFAEEQPELCKEAIAEGVRDAMIMQSEEMGDQISKVAFMRGYWDAHAIIDAVENE